VVIIGIPMSNFFARAFGPLANIRCKMGGGVRPRGALLHSRLLVAVVWLVTGSLGRSVVVEMFAAV